MAKQLTKERFDLFAIGTRMSPTRIVADELSFWSDLDENVLTNKLNRRSAKGLAYWEEEEAAGLPFVIAVADFHKTAGRDQRLAVTVLVDERRGTSEST